MGLKTFLVFSIFSLCGSLHAQIHQWGTVSALHVEGNHLLDAEGNQVMLHGVMDTPSPYFSGYRFTDGHWIDVYSSGDQYIDKCINYFDKLFTAVCDTAQGSWCNVFRLHLDPCWTDNPNVNATGFTTKNGKIYDPNGTEVSGEANIQHFDLNRLKKYISKLYLPIAKKAKGHGMYVIMRPPGVCPSTIKVNDYYQQYLLKVWDAVSKDADVQANSEWLSIELANEPVAIRDANGNNTNEAMHDFFQPIVDKIRSNGFKGIIWVPGGTWQQDYRPYAANPIIDPMLNEQGESAQQIGYAVHFYPGWFSTSDSQTDTIASIRSFLDGVPVVKTSPIMITEVDWSPEDPTGTGHYNESGQWVVPNCGTWATGSTSKFGKGYRAVINYFGNIGWTLTHTHDYLDIDYYLSSKIVRPAFSTKLENNAYEACSGACFKWYKEYAHTVHSARVWDTEASSEMFPLDEFGVNPSIWESGSWNASTGQLVTGQYGFGGWNFSVPLDLRAYKYIVVQLKQAAPDAGGYSPSFRLFCNNSYWTSPYCTNCGGKRIIAVPLKNQKNDDGSAFDPSHIYIAGFWTLGGAGNSVYIDKVFVSDDGVTPATDMEPVFEELNAGYETYSLDGLRVSDVRSGITIVRYSDGTVKKIMMK